LICREFDLGMMVLLNGKRRIWRAQEGWKELFEKADERFVFEGVKVPPGCNLAIVEASWAGDTDTDVDGSRPGARR
jgi:hypothetical protein